MTDRPWPRADAPPVYAIVVTYHPDDEVIANLRAMVRECGRLLVVDNGSGPAVCARMAAVPGVELLALPGNIGLAAALNRGAVRARESGGGWLVTFDQDSQPQPGFVEALWAAHLAVPGAAVIGPQIREAGFETSHYHWVRRHPRWPGLFQRVGCKGKEPFEVTMLMTSGSLVDLAVLESGGGFDDALFIDYIDTDFCLRVRRAGGRVMVAPGAILDHQLGDRRSRRVLGQDFRPTHHPAFRHYFISRNRVRIWRRHALAVPHWALFDLSFAIYNTFRVLAFEAGKGTKLKAMLLGTWDGLRGKTGPCPENRRHQLKG